MPAAGAAFIGEHAFFRRLAKGRPDEKDMERAKRFAEKIFTKLEMGTVSGPEIPGIPFPTGDIICRATGKGTLLISAG